MQSLPSKADKAGDNKLPIVLMNQTSSSFCIQIEWRCSKKGDRLQILVDDVEVPVNIGKNNLKIEK